MPGICSKSDKGEYSNSRENKCYIRPPKAACSMHVHEICTFPINSHVAFVQWFIGIKNHKYTMRLFIQAVILFLFLETEADIG